MKKMFYVVLITLVTVFISACNKTPNVEEVRQANIDKAIADQSKNQKLADLLETQRTTALNNANSSAVTYVSNNPRLQGYDIVSHTDSMISPDCIQGSGWSNISVMKKTKDDSGKQNVDKVSIWCSTSSQNVGCYRDEDIKQKPELVTYFKETKVCNSILAYPLKKFQGS